MVHEPPAFQGAGDWQQAVPLGLVCHHTGRKSPLLGQARHIAAPTVRTSRPSDRSMPVAARKNPPTGALAATSLFLQRSPATPESLAIALAVGIVLLEQQLWLVEKDTESSLRMHRVLEAHLKEWQQQWPNLTTVVAAHRILLDSMRPWSVDDILNWLILMTFAVPFAPHEPTELKNSDLENGLRQVVTSLGLKGSRVDAIYEVKNAVRSVFRSSHHKLMLGLGIGGLALLGLALPLAVPLIGAAAGLSGAAAFTAGLATLGGGAVAAGGLGMAGGLVAVSTGSAVSISGSLALRATQQQLAIPLALIEEDLAQRMVRWKVVTLDHQHDLRRAQAEIDTLRAEIHQIEPQISAELLLSSPKSDRVEELTDRVKAISKATTWMEERLNHRVKAEFKRN
jgi:hypothetical protein